MTVDLDVRSDVKQVTRMLTNLQKKQVPFATSKALNDTANDVQRAETAQLPKKLDRPTPFTMRAFGVKRSTKRKLIATVFIKDIQAEYLKYQIEGGRRTTEGKGTGVPYKNKKLNVYGNIPGRRKGLVKGKRQFIATIKGIPGVWEVRGKKRAPRLMIAFEKTVRYKERFPFVKIAEGTARNRFPRRFSAALEHAMRTAR